MISLYPNGSWQTAPIGEVCQRVQVSAYPDRYQPQAADAQILVDAVWHRPGAPAVAYDQGDGSMRIYRWSSTGDEFDRASDYDSGAFTLSSVDDRTASGDVDGDGDSWSGVWYTGGTMDLGRVAGRLVLGNW
ncbi:hypothetical protein Asp14428_15920 [Actinoplanes sp. NBRC 14428]|nr:hypothetical protein Asp14428_15920 [Actinoplanes sp. NBRC 14428]